MFIQWPANISHGCFANQKCQSSQYGPTFAKGGHKELAVYHVRADPCKMAVLNLTLMQAPYAQSLNSSIANSETLHGLVINCNKYEGVLFLILS